MGLIDTHNHIYLDDFDSEQDTLIAAARESGIEALLLPNVDTTTIERMLDVCERYPRYAYPMMGLHPTSVQADYGKDLRTVETWLGKKTFCGIGEIGIDLYWDKSHLKEQKEVFEEQLRWSVDLDLPVASHVRDAYMEVFDSIDKVKTERLRGVFHCFNGNVEELEEIKKLTHFRIGINGVVTFKNSKLPDVLRHTSIHNLVLETDAPYLAPVPYRGRRNEPVYIWKTAERVAEIYGLSLREVVEITKNNALELFKIVNKSLE